MTEQPRRIRAVVVDDEALSRALILEYLAEHPDVEVVGECANGFEAVRAVTELGPDLLFLDVQMPKLDGFEVLELVGADVDVIFVTAYDEYALRGFRGPRRRLPAQAVRGRALRRGARRGSGEARACGTGAGLPGRGQRPAGRRPPRAHPDPLGHDGGGGFRSDASTTSWARARLRRGRGRPGGNC